jgi:hypothetical protein
MPTPAATCPFASVVVSVCGSRLPIRAFLQVRKRFTYFLWAESRYLSPTVCSLASVPACVLVSMITGWLFPLSSCVTISFSTNSHTWWSADRYNSPTGSMTTGLSTGSGGPSLRWETHRGVATQSSLARRLGCAPVRTGLTPLGVETQRGEATQSSPARRLGCAPVRGLGRERSIASGRSLRQRQRVTIWSRADCTVHPCHPIAERCVRLLPRIHQKK